MADARPLRRLGGGRWESLDGRFRIEAQSGTWVVVDAEQTDDLGLPLVRGPYRSLTAARDAIADARDEGPSTSPLAERVEAAKARPADTRPARREAAKARPPNTRPARREGARATRAPRPEPDEPAWLAGLDDDQRRRARGLLRRLERAGVSDAEAVARAELVDGRPALAQRALERRIAAVVASAGDAESVARGIVEVIVSGEDASLGAEWRLTDAEGRPIRSLSVTRERI